MASPLKSGKQSVNLAGAAPRVSKIRRDPPPKVKEVELRDPDEIDRRAVTIGVVTFALAICVIIIAFSGYSRLVSQRVYGGVERRGVSGSGPARKPSQGPTTSKRRSMSF